MAAAHRSYQDAMSSTMNLDTVELINEIMIRPEIWMSKHPANRNKWKTMRKWEELKNAKFQMYTVDDLKKRWKNIKDQYRKELKKIPQVRPGIPLTNITSNWKYFEYMTFLKDELVKDGSQEWITDLEEQEIIGEASNPSQEYAMPEQIAEPTGMVKPERTESPQHSEHKSEDDDQLISIPAKRSYQPSKEMREELLKIEQKKLSILEAEVARNSALMQSDNYQFLMSVLPEMEKLAPVHKMRLRTKISQAVLEEVTAYEQEKFSNIALTHIQPGQVNGVTTVSVEVKEEPINMYD